MCQAPQTEWVCYILCCSDDSLYTGITNRLDERLKAHNEGRGAKYTRGRGPVRLLVSFPCESKSAALKLEAQIKKLSREKKLALCTLA